MEFKIRLNETKNVFKENAQTARIDKLRKEYNELFRVIEFSKALRIAFEEMLKVEQPKNKQNKTIALSCGDTLSELINSYRWQLGLTQSEIDKYGYFPLTVDEFRARGISQSRIDTAIKWLTRWNIIEIKYEQHKNRPDFKSKLFKINIDVLEKALPREEE